MLLESEHIKALNKILVKLTPDISELLKMHSVLIFGCNYFVEEAI